MVERYNFYVGRDTSQGPTADRYTTAEADVVMQVELAGTVNCDVELGSTVEFDVAHG